MNDGAWVAGALDLTLTTTSAPLGATLTDLVGLAVRRNPRRAHLLVSRVLGKHVPTDPHLVRGAALALGALATAVVALRPADDAALAPLRTALRAGLDGDARQLPAAALACASVLAAGTSFAPLVLGHPPLVLGYAETATSLGQGVAEALAHALGDADYLHSTRREVATARVVAGFEEEHSHATGHLLLPADQRLVQGSGPLVLVDDELSTGTTALNTIAALHALTPRRHYVIAALVDLRAGADRARADALAERLGVRLDVVALVTGQIEGPADLLERGARLVAQRPAAVTRPPSAVVAPVRRVDIAWPVDLPDGGRHGIGTAARRRWEELLPPMAARVADALGQGEDEAGDVLVLGTEELMHAPLRLAAALVDVLAERRDPRRVRSSSTTRSPVLAVDEPGYAVRTALTFDAHDEPADAGPRYAYNVAPGAGVQRCSTVVVVVDDAGDTPALHAGTGLLAALAGCCEEVLLVVLPSWRPLPPPLRGPAFGSYAPDEVGWLLTDLSGVALEAPTEEREEAVQLGGAHYAESLPVEYQPDAAYTELFTAALRASAPRVAHAVGVVMEQVLAQRGSDVVLASLARAGTPVGILMRRWARFAHDLDLPHWAVSIVRGRGLDRVALRHLAATGDPADVVFVDGWTGKGAITRELDAAIAEANTALGLTGTRGFSSELAVLADPGSCVRVFGTREDFLIPSACLNSTVSGLVSRTVLSDALLAPGAFHGAKSYADLAPVDLSATFLDAISDQFASVAASVARDWPVLAAADTEPTWKGWAAVEEITAAYDLGSVNLVKPGVGETTRVLLRRVPWRVLVRAGAGADLDHVRLLASQRGVPVEEVDDLPYACVGLIHPRFTRGATGADGTSAQGSAVAHPPLVIMGSRHPTGVAGSHDHVQVVGKGELR